VTLALAFNIGRNCKKNILRHYSANNTKNVFVVIVIKIYEGKCLVTLAPVFNIGLNYEKHSKTLFCDQQIKPFWSLRPKVRKVINTEYSLELVLILDAGTVEI